MRDVESEGGNQHTSNSSVGEIGDTTATVTWIYRV